MSKTVVVMSCAHVMPSVSNERFDWLGKFLYDLRPDEFWNLGDFSEMGSLSTFDSRNPQKLATRSYEKDIKHTFDAHDRMWYWFKHYKKGMPRRVFIQGNHEYRIDRAIEHDPMLAGKDYGISTSHLGIDTYYNEYHPYDNGSPALVLDDGVCYSHFISSGAYGKALYGYNLGSKLTEKMGCSVTVGHDHRFSYSVKPETMLGPQHGLVVGCFIGDQHDWAGQANREWSRGVAIKHGYGGGSYDLEWVSLERLRKEYGNS